MDLFRVRNEDTTGDQIEYVDENGEIYNSIFTFKEDAHLFKRRVMCEEKECNRYELLTEDCLEIHKFVYHRDQQFDNGHRSIKHSCKNKNEKLRCKTLIETNILGETKYKDQKGNEYSNIEIYEIGRLYQILKFRTAKRKVRGKKKESIS